MKTIDAAQAKNSPAQPSALTGMLGKARQAIAGPDVKAQDTVIERLERVLDNRFTILRNLPYFPSSMPAILTLVGPPGIWLLHASPLHGLFRVLDVRWEGDLGKGKGYMPLQPNLIEQMRAAPPVLAAVLGFDTGPDAELPAPIEPVVLFTDPSVHIDSQRPAVRLVPPDAIDRFASGLRKATPVMEMDEVRRMTDVLLNPTGDDEPLSESPFEHLDGRELAPAAARPASILDQAGQQPQVIKRIDQRTQMSPRQWAIIGGLITVNILILVIVILVALLNH